MRGRRALLLDVRDEGFQQGQKSLFLKNHAGMTDLARTYQLSVTSSDIPHQQQIVDRTAYYLFTDR
jgi:hypothetical protein